MSAARTCIIHIQKNDCKQKQHCAQASCTEASADLSTASTLPMTLHKGNRPASVTYLVHKRQQAEEFVQLILQRRPRHDAPPVGLR